MEIADRKEAFREELPLIRGQEAKKFFFKLLDKYPDYFFNNCPASSTGKYHPDFVQGPDGTLIHTKMVVRLTAELCRMYDLSEEETDAFVIAALTHDGWKQGIVKTTHTVKEHPELAAKAVFACYLENPGLLTNVQFDIVYQATRYHYGRWGNVPGNPLKIGGYFSIVHLADCSAAKLHEWTKGLITMEKFVPRNSQIVQEEPVLKKKNA